MPLLKKYIFLICLTITFYQSKSQLTDSSYLFYLSNHADLQKARGWNEDEISKTLENYKTNNINSNNDFADLLKRYYPVKKDLAILLYFYNDNILRRILFEPGSIKQDDSIRISKDSLYQLSVGLSKALDLYKLTADRAPKTRGLIVKSDNSKKYNLDSTLQKLTAILLPIHFSESYKHLIIIPCLNIGTLPFHLLKPYHNNRYLIEQCSFTVAPTLLDFVFQHTKSEMNQSRYNDYRYTDSLRFSFDKPLFISNPQYPKNTQYDFPNLPGAEQEIKNALTHAYNGYTLLKGKDAVKDSILKYLDGSDIAYFATHGIADVNNPMTNSFLVVSGKDPLLTSKEIQDLRLKANFHAPEMVVLSACQTGLGKSMDAGVAGSIARSFILSGSDYIIESLWNVDDKATAYLMNRFVYYVTERQTQYFPAGALRLAILDTKKQFPNPIFWASFSTFGATW